jgi:hypothetical protein
MASTHWTVILTAAIAAAGMCSTKVNGRRERHCMSEASDSKGVRVGYSLSFKGPGIPEMFSREVRVVG